ncbi:MAG: FixH family protein [Rhodocyclaceae bacterium]|nr:FixH family protein [Rhodocyclaceae bacterium]
MSAPWYKHRWPWIVMAGPGIVVVASFVTLYLAVKSNDGLVAEDYYKQGLAINRVLDRETLARTLGIAATAAITSDRVVVDLKSVADLPSGIRVTLTHPTRAGMDQSVLLHGIGGRYQGALSSVIPGTWLVVISDEANTWRVSSDIHLPEQKEINIVPAVAAQH